jgi:hypothetical protein
VLSATIKLLVTLSKCMLDLNAGIQICYLLLIHYYYYMVCEY